MDKQVRNRLQKLVSNCRSLLDKEFTAQLQMIYGMQPTGRIDELSTLTHLDNEQYRIATLLRERVNHLSGLVSDGKEASREAVQRLIREQAFTMLNRFAALKMCEERDITQECFKSGYQSKGFQLFLATCGSGIGDSYQRYVVFIKSIFDELSLDLGVLFDRFTPFGLLFPRENAMGKLFAELNTPELSDIWKEDEAIGWVYQYFNSKEERQAMRKSSSAPRNSRELAVRNQFFTPRYVVQFLTDNTLGRIWYEMTGGDTELKGQCEYLVRRPQEVFLAEGENPPDVPEEEGDKSQEELLKEPEYISHRKIKDPRKIRMLDPACGSMHFGLYAFDLYETIYEEAWDNYPELLQDIRERIKEKQEFLSIVPELIIRHNIHGIDIDHRAVQIAGLSLWLRAQKSYQLLGIKPEDRPRITRSNVVCAEPMPGEKDYLEEFVSGLKPAVLGDLVKDVWEKMQLAGEAGSLLKIEEELSDSIRKAREVWEKYKFEKGAYAEQDLFEKRKQLSLKEMIKFDIGDVESTEEWDQMEGMVLSALREFAESASGNGGYDRKLFAEDAAQGFAFIDVCRKRYDVVLMNPPFGSITLKSKFYLKKTYSNQSEDMYCYFVDRGYSITSNGILGIISSGSFIRYTDYIKYREYLIDNELLKILLDLGWDVLDEAYVNAVIYILGTQKRKYSYFVSLNDSSNQSNDLSKIVNDIKDDRENKNTYIHSLKRFNSIISSPICYWFSNDFFNWINKSSKIKDILFEHGIGAGPHNIFFRLFWELSCRSRTNPKRWPGLSNGGFFSPYYRDNYLCIDWRNNGSLIKAHLNKIYPYLNGNVGIKIQREHIYFRSGITHGKRGDRFNAQILPAGFIPSFEGIGLYPIKDKETWWLLSYLNSHFVAYYLNLTCGLHKNSVYIDRVPVPCISEDVKEEISENSKKIYFLLRQINSTTEISPVFSQPNFTLYRADSISKTAIQCRKRNRLDELTLWSMQSKIDNLLLKVLEEISHLKNEIEKDQGASPCTFLNDKYQGRIKVVDKTKHRGRPIINLDDGQESTDLYRFIITNELNIQLGTKILNESEYISNLDLYKTSSELISYLIGNCCGRWDIRIALNPDLAPNLADPFDPLPVCPPGMLVGPDGLPAESGRIVSEEWLRARPNTITFPPEGSVKTPVIPDSEYPIEVTWNGILVDDPSHKDDIIGRMRQCFQVIWQEKADSIEQEACEILDIKDLRDYFRRSSGFFADHLKRYSKSRRQAPIYWPLSTASGSYTLWIYYPRLTDQTLYRCVNDYINPKFEHIAREIELQQKEIEKSKAMKARQELEDLLNMQQEIRELKDELLRVAELPYKPNLNDGVLITASPLCKLFRLGKWKKDLSKCWESLEKGDYDWAHLAHSIWPDRVREKCRKDRSLAIAHDLEDTCEVEPKAAKKKAKSNTTEGKQIDLM